MEVSCDVSLFFASRTTPVCVSEILSCLRWRFEEKDIACIERVLAPQQDVVRCHIADHFAFLDDLQELDAECCIHRPKLVSAMSVDLIAMGVKGPERERTSRLD